MKVQLNNTKLQPTPPAPPQKTIITNAFPYIQRRIFASFKKDFGKTTSIEGDKWWVNTQLNIPINQIISANMYELHGQYYVHVPEAKVASYNLGGVDTKYISTCERAPFYFEADPNKGIGTVEMWLDHEPNDACYVTVIYYITI